MQEKQPIEIRCEEVIEVISLEEASSTLEMVSYLKKWQRPADYTEAIDDYTLRSKSALGECQTWLIPCGFIGDAYVVTDPTIGKTALVCPQCKKEVTGE